MVTGDEQFMDLVLISQITQSRYGWLRLFKGYDILRCDANPKNLDADGANPRWQGKTNFLINTWDPGILWSDFGVRSDVLVHFLFCFHHSLSSHSSTRSHSLTTSPGLIYTNYYPLTYYIKSSKGLLKITSLNGSTNTWF